MSQTEYAMVRVDKEVHESIRQQAKPFDTMNAILRRVLGLPEAIRDKGGRPKGSKNKKGKRR